MKYVTELLKVIVIMAIVIVGIGAAQAWTGPSATPPAGNVGAPLNITSSTQEKNGILGSHGFYSLGSAWFSLTTRPSWPPSNLTLGVNGAVGATTYCDDNGANCHSSTEIGGVPTGAVMAFNLSSCPTGWTAYTTAQGKNIIGVNSSYALGSTGGAESDVLTADNLPRHTHSLGGTFNTTAGSFNSDGDNVNSGYQVLGYGITPGRNRLAVTLSGTTGASGLVNPDAVPVMDPYVALLYCSKN